MHAATTTGTSTSASPAVFYCSLQPLGRRIRSAESPASIYTKLVGNRRYETICRTNSCSQQRQQVKFPLKKKRSKWIKRQATDHSKHAATSIDLHKSGTKSKHKRLHPSNHRSPLLQLKFHWKKNRSKWIKRQATDRSEHAVTSIDPHESGTKSKYKQLHPTTDLSAGNSSSHKNPKSGDGTVLHLKIRNSQSYADSSVRIKASLVAKSTI